jgi:hypothetical protein
MSHDTKIPGSTTIEVESTDAQGDLAIMQEVLDAAGMREGEHVKLRLSGWKDAADLRKQAKAQVAEQLAKQRK